MTAASADRDITTLEGRIVALPVAAATTIYLGTAVGTTLATGYATSLTNSALLRFMGVAEEGVINTVAEGYGAAGDLDVRLAKDGVCSFVSSGLAITDQGCQLFFADNQTVQKTPTAQPAGILARFTTATEALVDISSAVGKSSIEFLAGKEYRVPTDIQTAAFTGAVDGAWEDEDIVALLNASTVLDVATGQSVRVRGSLEVIAADAVAHTVLYADGDTTAGIDKVTSYTTPAAIGSYFVDADLVTDASGNIKIQVDVVAQCTLRFHLKGYNYVVPVAVA